MRVPQGMCELRARDTSAFQCAGASRNAISVSRRKVGARNAETVEDLDLEPLHLLGLRLRAVIEAQEMQETVDDEMLEVMSGRNAELGRLARDGPFGEHDIAQARHRAGPCAGRPPGREGENVGRAVLAAVRPVEAANRLIVAQGDASLRRTGAFETLMAGQRPACTQSEPPGRSEL